MRKRSKLHRINSNITPIFFAALSVVCLILSCFAIHLINATSDKIKSDLELESARIERDFVDKIDHTFSIIKSINLQIEENPTNKNHINEILKRYRSHPSLSDTFSWTLFSWSDENYQIIVDSKYGIMKEPVDFSTQDYVPMTEKNPWQFNLGTPVIGVTSHKWMIPGGVGITNQKGEYLGATTIGFEIETLAKSFHEIIQNPDVKFELFGKNEVGILYSDTKSYGVYKSNDDSSYNPKIGKILDEINSLKSDNVFDISLITNRHAFLAKRVTDYPYIMLLQYDSSAIIANFWKIVLSKMLGISLVTLGLAVLLFLIYHERRQAQKILILKREAELAHEAKAEFLTHSIHEFRNFVFGIQGCAEIVKNDLRSLISKLKKVKTFEKEEIDELETDFDLSCDIIESSHELNDFINDLTDLNQAENGEFKINKSNKAVHVARIIKQSIKLLDKRAKNSDITLVNKVEEDLHEIPDLDPRRIKQIMLNLISNAIKHSQENGKIEISAQNITNRKELEKLNDEIGTARSKRIEIIVKDYGFGMSENELRAVMQKYQAIDNITTGRIDALGLGLPIVKYLVEKQKGLLEIKSEKNRGTKIKVIF